jgi:RNA polymerase sigma-70 factor (ECF subfamily)
MDVRPSPVIALNRAIAIGECAGAQRGLEAIREIADPERLARYPFYFAALGRFELQSGEYENAREHFLAALALARNPMERHFLEQRVIACNSSSAQQAL